MDLALALLLFAAFLATACPGVHWLDGGELTASAWVVANAHPPGEPLFILLVRPFLTLPLGDIAFRANLFSAAAAALSFLPAAWLGRRVSVRLWGERGRWLGTAAALGATLNGAAWLQAVRAEVYSLEALLTWTAAAVLLGWGRLPASARWTLGGFLAGLASANHPLLLLAHAPALLLFGLAISSKTLGKEISKGVLAGVLGLSPYLLLPIRSAVRPDDSWGLPHHLNTFIEVLTGRAFAQNFTVGEGASYGANLASLGSLFFQHTGAALLALAGVGWVMLLRRGAVAEGMGLLLWVVGTAATILPQNKVFPDNPDLHGYLVVGVGAVCLLAGAGFAGLFASLALRVRPSLLEGLSLAAAAVLLAPALPGMTSGNRAGNHLAHQFGWGLQQGLPGGSLLITAGTDATFLLRYGRVVEGWRPDLRVVHRLLLGHSFYDAALSRSRPPLPEELDLQRLRSDLPAALDALDLPAFYEFRERDRRALAHSLPLGSLMAFVPGPEVPLSAASLELHQERARSALPPLDPASLGGDVHAAGVTAYAHDLLRGFFLARSRPDLALLQQKALRGLDPSCCTESPFWVDRNGP